MFDIPDISRLAPSQVSVGDDISEQPLFELETTTVEAMPQAVVSLLQQLIPEQAKLALGVSRPVEMSEKPTRSGVARALEHSLGKAGAALIQRSFSIDGLHTAPARSVPLPQALTHSLNKAVQPMPEDEAPDTEPVDSSSLRPVAIAVHARLLERIFASGLAQANERSTPQQAAPRAAIPLLSYEKGRSGGSYLRLPFTREGVTGVITVSRQTDRQAAPLQLSANLPEIAIHLARQLESAPQPYWSMAENQVADTTDEGGGGQSRDPSDEQAEDSPRQWLEEEGHA